MSARFAAEAFFEGGGVEIDVPVDLGHLEGEGAEAGGDGFGFKAVGIAQAFLCALVRSGIEGAVAFGLHGFVDEKSETLGKGVLVVI